ncbi:hypothetical protein RSOL_410140 [Rhizoctonia solani AG-3 Rhs1AP]|uniref:Uncharacterized protein n=1 Tax=Rhizoctonia solani AG-3 Rhs1AP TaxID=1086054 RepID=X8JG72_9AGAM|nr:hypothetical protein RSOL_410140 [Rhizoctonia solani AG-3 Rhs1AP]
MPPKRTNPSTSTTKSGGASKKAKVTTKGKKATPKLPKSTPPNWQRLHPEWAVNMPKGTNAKLCIEKWCLLAPYGHGITEKQWKAYHDERSALDQDNTCGYDARPTLKPEYLCANPWRVLEFASQSIASAIYGSVLDEDEKTAIARTIRGSLYFIELEGEDDDGPRSVSAKTRLYSPFGIGTSVDFAYDYHFRYREGEQFGSLIAMSNSVEDLDPEKPRKSKAIKGFDTPKPGSVKIFSWNGSNKISATMVARINSFEPTLFGSTGWLSPLKLHNILFAAGTGLSYDEHSYPTNPEIASREKFTFFEGETTGGDLSKSEDALYKELEEEEPEEDLGDVYLSDDEKAGCVPRRLLLLARQE